MKTILYVYHTSTIGGGSYCLLNILKSIDKSYMRPVVLLKENGPLVSEIIKLDIPVYFLSTLSTVPYNVSILTLKKLINTYKLITSLSRYKKLLREINPDIVYINTMMLYPYLRRAKEFGISTIIHIREHWSEGEHKWQRNMALNYIDKYADHIVAINSYSASMFNFSSKSKTIVYDWIDLSCRYKEMPLSKIFNEDLTEKKVYLYMGGMQPIKGAYEIVSTFSQSILDPNARLLVMGFSGPQGYSKRWRDRLKKILSCIGWVAYSEKVMQVIKADSRILCIPSEYMINHIIQQAYCILSYFTIPHANLSLAESIILGTPSIAADTEESQEYSLNGQLACLFRINDIEDFKKKIQQFDVIRPFLLKKIAAHSCEISEKFNPVINSKKLNSIYKSL